MGEVHRDRYLPVGRAQVLGDALQPVRRRAVYGDLPHLGALSGRQRRGRLPGRRLHRLQVVHESLPLRRALHQPGDQHRPQVQHVQSPCRGRPAAVVPDRVPDRGDQDRRPRRSHQRDQSDHRPGRRRRPGAGAEHQAEGLLPGGRSGQPRPDPDRHRHRRHDLGRHDPNRNRTAASHAPRAHGRPPDGYRRGRGPHRLHHGAPDDLEGEGRATWSPRPSPPA